MIRLVLLISVSFILILTTSGCMDIVEPNQLAFVLGSAIDHADNGEIEVSYQIVTPTQKTGPFKESSGNSESFFVISAKGRNVFEATQKIQKKLSRRLLTSHRILIAISENYFNKNDVSKLFDKLNRDPANNQRDIIVMVKGSAKEFLMIGHPMEHLSSIGAGKELQINGMNSFSTRQFIIDSVTEGIRPLVPTIQIENKKLSIKGATPIAGISSYAVLNNKLKIEGFLNNMEGSGAVWMAGKGTFQGITIPWEDGKGTLSFRFTHLGRQIHSESRNNPEQIKLTVKAQAYLLENTTSLDMSEVDNMIEVQKYVNEEVQKELQATMDKVQQWGSDIFGIGEHLHRKYPYWWKLQRDDWDEKFKKIDVTVKADIQLMSNGTSGAQLK
ncbi:Ger(x)C family spore germination protein [Paenibacillus sp. V4I7]|uniref:Ger(x)C family spore germination protein n=1 Tax=Paenibacillus sp. V4I7 TaxID=3042307 RepID=UPI002788E2CA|nr:Ger(x)C family spore germination protein [Paenibacillus sp. V4I7]MDQ0897485.1 spore germination protein KC [Paenibacillus sp. V4I7]